MNLSKSIVAAALVSTIFAGAAIADEAAEKLFTGYVGASAKTGYLSNGKLFVDDPVLQPYAGIDFCGFNFDIWASQDLKDDEENGYEEIDYTLTYSGAFGDVGYSIGATIWAYDNSQNDYRAFASVSYNALPVTPSVYVRYNIDNCYNDDHGIYGQFKLAKGFDLCDNLSLSLSALVGYADSDYRKTSWAQDNCGFLDFEANVELSYSVTDQLSLSLGCTYNSVIDSDIRDFEDDPETSLQADGESDHVIGYFGACISL